MKTSRHSIGARSMTLLLACRDLLILSDDCGEIKSTITEQQAHAIMISTLFAGYHGPNP